MKTSTKARLGAVLSGALLLTGIGVAANADNSVGVSSNAVIVSYYTANDTLSVLDNKSDGYGGRSLWNRTSDGWNGNLDNDKGAGHTTTRTIGGTGNVNFNACRKQGATTINCSGYVSSAA